jgi:hypothetical protein
MTNQGDSTANPITLKPSDDCTDAEKSGLMDRQNLLNKIIMSKYFEDAIMGFKTINMLNGNSRAEMLAKVRAPRTLTVDYYSDTDPDDENVDGYEEEDEENTVHMHREALQEFEFSIQDEVSCIAHELGHCAGFSHRGNSPDAFNLTTVCYRINQAVDSWEE